MARIASPLVLALSSDDPAYTTLTIHANTASAVVLYTTETDYRSGKHPVTTLRNRHAQVVASLERHEVMSDIVILPDEGGYGQSSLRLAKWMRQGLFKRSTCTFEDKRGRKYEWRGYTIGRSLQLWAADTPSYPIAYFTKRRPRIRLPSRAVLPSSKTTFELTLSPLTTSPSSSTGFLPRCTLPNISPTTPATYSTLTLQPRAVEIQDLVVSSYLFLERNRRIREATKNMSICAGTLGGPSGCST